MKEEARVCVNDNGKQKDKNKNKMEEARVCVNDKRQAK
jgi:hypothetical protein